MEPPPLLQPSKTAPLVTRLLRFHCTAVDPNLQNFANAIIFATLTAKLVPQKYSHELIIIIDDLIIVTLAHLCGTCTLLLQKSVFYMLYIVYY